MAYIRKKGATRRAYIKNYSADRSPKGGKPPNKDVIQQYKDHASNPRIAEPVRKVIPVLTIDGTGKQHSNRFIISIKQTPSITEPRKERTEKLHKIWRNERTTNKVVIARTSLFVFWYCNNGYDRAAAHWIERLEIGTQMLSISITYSSRQSALETAMGKARNPLAWKAKVPFVGDEGT